MGRGLYENEPIFKEKVDECSRLLEPLIDVDLRKIIYPTEVGTQKAAEQLTRTSITQPALFVVEYALAFLWKSWSIEPAAMIGHSIGEYVAACLSGVFTLKHALELVAARGRLMQSMPSGAMLAVSLTEKEMSGRIGKDVTISTINTGSQCVVSGTREAIKNLETHLMSEGIVCKQLRTSHAFHSPMMDPILDTFKDTVRKARPQTPEIPFVSNVTGTWITNAEATDPQYWAMHLRQTVRFADGLKTLLQSPGLSGQVAGDVVSYKPDEIKVVGEHRLNIGIAEEMVHLNQLERKLEKRLAIKGIKNYEGLEETLDQLCTSYIYNYFIGSDMDAKSGQIYTKQELKKEFGNIIEV